MIAWEEKNIIGQTLVDMTGTYPEFYIVTGITRTFNGEIDGVQVLNTYGTTKQIPKFDIKGLDDTGSADCYQYNYELASASTVDRIMDKRKEREKENGNCF